MAGSSKRFLSIISLLSVLAAVEAFTVNKKFTPIHVATLEYNSKQSHTTLLKANNDGEDVYNLNTDSIFQPNRRSVLASILTTTATTLLSFKANADDEEATGSFESIAARAARIAKTVEEEKSSVDMVKKATAPVDTRTVYDFSLPVAGQQTTFSDLIRQEYEPSTEEGVPGKAKVKAILVVNIKQDDPIARKNIAEFISLASKYGPSGFAVLCIPTDQGYYEPDTSTLIRLKLRAEYGYGINPATALTDKINLLGTGAHPFMRWIQNNCRTPAGLGKIQGNFEKFLVDGQTGKPLRRYPRKYNPYDISNDIEALLKGSPLPPPIADYYEEWRGAAYDAERDTYRFQKGLNVFDQ